jgi:hypothetical protein
MHACPLSPQHRFVSNELTSIIRAHLATSQHSADAPRRAADPPQEGAADVLSIQQACRNAAPHCGAAMPFRNAGLQ